MSTTEKDGSNILRGTTLRVYHFMFKVGKPVGIHELQRGLGLSSPSLALYHINKLVQAGLIREQDNGYLVDKIVFANMIRIKRTLIPFQTTYTVFFAVTLMILLTYLRPLEVTSTYVFALVVNSVAIATSLYEVIRALRKI